MIKKLLELDEMGLGPTGKCICSKCGYEQPKRAGVLCQDEKCPKCKTSLIRKGGECDKATEDLPEAGVSDLGKSASKVLAMIKIPRDIGPLGDSKLTIKKGAKVYYKVSKSSDGSVQVLFYKDDKGKKLLGGVNYDKEKEFKKDFGESINKITQKIIEAKSELNDFKKDYVDYYENVFRVSDDFIIDLGEFASNKSVQKLAGSLESLKKQLDDVVAKIKKLR